MEPQTDAAPPRTIRARVSTPNGDRREVVNATRYAVDRVRGGLPRDQAAAMCHRFLKEFVEYVPDMGHQMVRMPWRTVEDGEADCKSQAVFVAAMCGASGCRVSLRFVRWAGEDYFGHVYAMVDGSPCDPLCDLGAEDPFAQCIDVPITDGQ